MSIATEASTVEAMMPNAGTCLEDRRLNRAGNRPSFAAASGISAQIMVQPVSAPSPEMITARAIRLPAQVPPKMALAASENGAFALASCELGMIPKITVRDSR
jgi:hypothetical protein